MPTKSSTILCRWIALSLMALVFGVTILRASVQSIAHDEALTYEWFLEGSTNQLLKFNTTNHVLFTIIAKFFVSVFGVSEFSLRAPSLFGAATYLGFTYLLSRKLFGDGILLPLSVTLLCLNPLIMDFMAAARGYSLGMAFLAAAMYFLARMTDQESFRLEDATWRRDCAVTSVFMALSVAASLTNLIPAMSLALSLAAIKLRGRLNFRALGDRSVRIFAKYLIFPGLVVGVIILWPFLIQARPAMFNMGLHHGSDAVRDLFSSSFLYKWTGDVYSTSLGAVPPIAGSWQQRVSDLGVYVIFPLAFFFVLFSLIFTLRGRRESDGSQTRHFQLFGVAAIASVVVTVLLHVVAKVNYPNSRTCLYFIQLFTISVMLSARELGLRFPRSLLKLIGWMIVVAVLFDYTLSLNTKYFRYNAYDVISRQLFKTISQDAQARGLTGVRVGGTWWYEPEMNFYRRRYGAEWMKPYDVKDRSYFWESPNSLAPAEYDYFVFTPASDPGLTSPRIKTIFRDATTGIVINTIYK
jgi:hypothetical protein